jgi:hypothetical protein
MVRPCLFLEAEMHEKQKWQAPLTLIALYLIKSVRPALGIILTSVLLVLPFNRRA